jgi:hypothetical protein
MIAKNSGLQYLKGKAAYRIFWEQYYHCLPRLSSIMAIDHNLEIIVNENRIMLAFRHDVIQDMRWMVINDGHWHIVDDDNIGQDLIYKVNVMIVNKKREICLN